jgi:predicted DCC family thiol-disulfide oxidoreductase YuxK
LFKVTANEAIDRDIVIFDGHCKLCRAGVLRLQSLDWLGHFRFVSLHEPEIREQFPDLTYEMLMAEMFVVTQKGDRKGGAAALRYMSWFIPLMWPLAPFLSIPGTLPIWSFLYKLIAKNRYRFGRLEECEGGTCSLHFGGKPPAQAKN